MIDQKLWRKKNFSMRIQDHTLNEIVHSGFIGITANKIYFCFQIPQAATLGFLLCNEGGKQKSLFFSLLL